MSDDKPRSNKLPENRCVAAGYTLRRFDVTLPEGTLFEDLLRPAFWANVAKKFERCAMVDAVTDDGSFYAQMLVTNAGSGFAEVVTINHVDLQPSTEEELSADFAVAWKGPHLKYAVIRQSDKEMLKSGFVKRVDAETWAREHKQVIA